MENDLTGHTKTPVHFAWKACKTVGISFGVLIAFVYFAYTKNRNRYTGPRLNIKNVYSRYGDPHVNNKTAAASRFQPPV